MSHDPYASPAYSPSSVGTARDGGVVSPAVVQQLAQTKPWVRLISVVSFLGAALLLVVGLVMMFVSSAVMPAAGLGAGYAAGFRIGMALFYLLFAVLYIYPALKLWNYASAIARLMNTWSVADLEAALSYQKSFWRFVGILLLLVISVYLFVLIFAVVVGSAAAFAK